MMSSSIRRVGMAAMLLASSEAFAQAPRLSSPPPAAATAPLPQSTGRPAIGGLEDLTLPPSASQAAVPPPVAAAPAPTAVGTAAPGRTPEDEAFENAVKNLVPLSPDQIKEFRRRQDEARRAQSLPLKPVRPITRTISLTLKPGEPTPVIRVAAQNVSTLTFVDVTGKPWPVLSVATGDPTMLEAKSAGPQNETNIITLSPIKYQGATNVAVTLTKYPVPIVMSVTTGETEVDYRVDVRVGARGPNAVADMLGTGGLSPTNDATLIGFIDGTPPRGAERVSTSSRDVEAWMFDKNMYIRTSLELLSPAYLQKSSGNAGVNVYQLAESTPVLIVSRDGQMASVTTRR